MKKTPPLISFYPFSISFQLIFYCNRYGVEPFLSVMCQQSSRNQVNHRPKSAGIANCKYSYLCHVKRRADHTILNYSLAILRLLFYIYCFIIISFATGPLSVCVTAIFSHIPCNELLMSYFSNENGTILSNCLLINFVSLTLHAQASIYSILIFKKDFFTSVRSQLCYLFTLLLKTVLIRQKKSHQLF